MGIKRLDVDSLKDESPITIILKELSNLVSFITLDVDVEYYELLSLAIEYGMKPNEFWNNDIQEFYCYQVAHINKSYNEAYQNGFYNYVAFSTVMANVFKEKNKPVQEYPKENEFNPLNELKKKNEKAMAISEVAKKQTDMFHIKRTLQKNSERKEDNK